VARVLRRVGQAHSVTQAVVRGNGDFVSVPVRTLVTVDPDVKLSGATLSRDGCIVAAALVESSRAAIYSYLRYVGSPFDIMVESQVIRQSTTLAQANKLLSLAEVTERWLLATYLITGASFGDTCKVLPENWKRQQKKWHNHLAAWREMVDSERAVVARAAGKSQDSVLAYIERACNAHAIGKEPSYASRLSELLDSTAMNLVFSGRLTIHGDKGAHSCQR